MVSQPLPASKFSRTGKRFVKSASSPVWVKSREWHVEIRERLQRLESASLEKQKMLMHAPNAFFFIKGVT